jgi:hypothetical protein
LSSDVQAEKLVAAFRVAFLELGYPYTCTQVSADVIESVKSESSFGGIYKAKKDSADMLENLIRDVCEHFSAWTGRSAPMLVISEILLSEIINIT